MQICSSTVSSYNYFKCVISVSELSAEISELLEVILGIRPLIIYIISLRALNFLHAFSKDCSIRVICFQFTKCVCFIRVVVIDKSEYIHLL